MPSSDNYKEKYKKCLEEVKEIGFVEKIVPPIIYVKGLPGARIWEVVYFENGYLGLVTSLIQDYVEVLVFTNDGIPIGTPVSRADEILQIPVGEGLTSQILAPGSPLT